MHEFLPNAFRLLQKYKSLLKKQLNQEERQKSLVELQLDGDLPRDEVSLYRLLESVLNHIKAQTANKFENVRFSGTLKFLKDTENLLSWYRLEKGHVIHASQEASRAMVMAIQLIVLPSEKRTKKIAKQLDQYALKIAKYGLKEQQLVFLDSLKKSINQDKSFFNSLIVNYQEYLQKHAGVGVRIGLVE